MPSFVSVRRAVIKLACVYCFAVVLPMSVGALNSRVTFSVFIRTGAVAEDDEEMV